MPVILQNDRITESVLILVQNGSNTAGTDSAATLTDSEGKTLLHSDGVDELDGHLDVIARHAHLSSLGKGDNTGNVSCSEIELRTIVVEERGMTAAFIFGQDVDLSGEFLVAGNGAGLCNNLATLDSGSLNTTKKKAYVVACLCVIQSLAEHLDNDRRL